MAAENPLVRRQGKGTFVATHSDPRSFFRFLRLAPDGGELVPSPERAARMRPRQSRRRCRAHARPDTQGADHHHAPTAPVLRRSRGFDEIYLPGELFQDLSLDILKQSDKSLYDLFESRYGVRMIRAEERLRAVAADRVAAELLKVDEGSPLLLVERVAFTYGNKPVEWRRGFYATRHHHYFNELT